MNTPPIKPGGFTEAGIVTANPEEWIKTLVRIGGYEEIWRGSSPESLNRLWDIPYDAAVSEILVGNPKNKSGAIRLFNISGVKQEVIRSGTNTWDSGGIFDLDIRVQTLKPFVGPLEDLGWQGISKPIDWQFGQVKVREWLTRGPDAVILALIERLAPPLEGFDELNGFSHVFNSSQVVADINVAVDFYQSLGFETILDQRAPLEGRGGEVLGLTRSEAPATPVDLVIMQPEGKLDGSVELVKIHGKSGRNVANHAHPYNLGLNLLRFPVNGLEAYATQIQRNGIGLSGPGVIATRLEPFGETSILPVRTPDGAWLEFYERIP